MKSMFIWTFTFVFVIAKTVARSESDIRIGTTYPDTYTHADVIIIYDKMGLKMCGRRCLYQDQCEGINYNPKTLMCELLKAGGKPVVSTGYLYSPINTWTMKHDKCYQNPCDSTKKCLKTKNKTHVCVKTVAFYTNITLSSSQYINNDFRPYGYFNAGTGVRWLVRFVTMDTTFYSDFIMIYDGRNASSPLLAIESGITLPGDVVTSGQYLFIVWITSNSDTFGGWRIDLYKMFC